MISRGRMRGLVPSLRLGLSVTLASARRELVLAVVASGLAALTSAGQLLAAQRVVSILIADADGVSFGELAPWLGLLGLCLTVAGVAAAASTELTFVMAELVKRATTAEVLRLTATQELESFEEPTFLDALSRARHDTQEHGFALVWGLVTLVQTVAVAVAVTAVVAITVPIVIPLALVAYAPLAVVVSRNSRALYDAEYSLTTSDRERSYLEGVLTDRQMVKEVVSYGLTVVLADRHAALHTARIREVRRVARERAVRALGGSLLSSVLLIGVLGVLLALVTRERLELPAATVGILGLYQLVGRLRSLGSGAATIVEGSLFVSNFLAFRDMATTAHQRATRGRDDQMPSLTTSLQLDEVGFRYPGTDRDVLRGISVVIPARSLVAIVGANGSGKSTLAKLLAGAYRCSSGLISWDGTDIALVDPERLRRRIAIVYQDYARLQLTAQENIGLGDVERIDDVDSIVEAARWSQADGFIDRLPHGYRSRLGRDFEGATEPSVGQWQRLAIARAAFRGADLLILDEPTSALDPEAEIDLVERLRGLTALSTVVMVSHRLWTVRQADLIIVMDGGRIVEQGHHDELMAAPSLYARLFAAQAEGLAG